MILLLGATGLLGGQVLRALLERNIEVRAYTRGSSNWKDASISDLRRRGVDITLADVLDDEKLSAAIEGCTAIINLIGIFKEKEDSTFQAVHIDAVERLLAHAEAHGVQRFIHVSCLGSTEHSISPYLETKWAGEQLVLKSNLYWTILKPSFMFGEKFPLMEWLSPLVKFKPFMPIIGSGLNEIQPVSLDDVARCLVECIYDRRAVSKVYELGGPEIYSMVDLMELIRSELGLPKNSVVVPAPAVKPVIKMLAKAGLNPTPHMDMLPLLTVDSTCHDNVLEELLGCPAQSLNKRLTKILSRI
jgi:uncharacterized protein YbjT (DUF2867 family)